MRSRPIPSLVAAEWLAQHLLPVLMAFALGVLADMLVADQRAAEQQQALIDEAHDARRQAAALLRLVVAADAQCGAPAGVPVQPAEQAERVPELVVDARSAGGRP